MGTFCQKITSIMRLKCFSGSESDTSLVSDLTFRGQEPKTFFRQAERNRRPADLEVRDPQAAGQGRVRHRVEGTVAAFRTRRRRQEDLRRLPEQDRRAAHVPGNRLSQRIQVRFRSRSDP